MENALYHVAGDGYGRPWWRWSTVRAGGGRWGGGKDFGEENGLVLSLMLYPNFFLKKKWYDMAWCHVRQDGRRGVAGRRIGITRQM